MTTFTPVLNVGLLLQAKQQMLLDYGNINMLDWVSTYRILSTGICRTVACIGGTACLIAGIRKGRIGFVTSAQVLGLAPDPINMHDFITRDDYETGFDIARKLFGVSEWEDRAFRDRIYMLQAGTFEYALCVADYIDWFIWKYGPKQLAAPPVVKHESVLTTAEHLAIKFAPRFLVGPTVLEGAEMVEEELEEVGV